LVNIQLIKTTFIGHCAPQFDVDVRLRTYFIMKDSTGGLDTNHVV
jgi:hypothetical protein